MTAASPDEMRRYDALYEPFPPFADWLRLPENLAAQWDELVERLAELRAEATEEDFAAVRDEAMRSAAWDTGAIEGLYTTTRGFTITVATQAAGWEAQVRREKGDDALAMFKAQLEAYEQALDAATEATPISDAWLRHLHEVATAAQDEYTVHTAAGDQAHDLPKGEYKRYPNHILQADGRVFAHAPVADVPAEVGRLVGELRSGAFADGHPIEQASYAHYALVRIHPFADGNGRVARALASVFTLRALSLPLVIYSDERLRYLDTLARADQTDALAFLAFVFDTLVETYSDVSDGLRGAPSSVSSGLDRLDPAELTDEQQRAVGLRLMQRARLVLEKALRDASPSVLLLADITVRQVEGSPGPRTGYRSLQRSPQRAQPGLEIRAVSGVDREVGSTMHLWPMLRDGDRPLFDVLLAGPEHAEIGFRFAALVPRVTERVKRRLEHWAQALVDRLVADVADPPGPTAAPGGSAG